MIRVGVVALAISTTHHRRVKDPAKGPWLSTDAAFSIFSGHQAIPRTALAANSRAIGERAQYSSCFSQGLPPNSYSQSSWYIDVPVSTGDGRFRRHCAPPVANRATRWDSARERARNFRTVERDVIREAGVGDRCLELPTGLGHLETERPQHYEHIWPDGVFRVAKQCWQKGGCLRILPSTST